MSIAHNIEVIYDKISNAATRAENRLSDITIVCVTKNRLLEEIYQVLDAGIANIGESKVQEAQQKFTVLNEYVKDIDSHFIFHMIGHLQTNKVDNALDIFDMIQSVDSFKLAQRISEGAKERHANSKILVEVNTSQEESKFGVSTENTIALLRDISNLDNICVRGLMTMAPLAGDPEDARPYFQGLRELRDKINEIKESLFNQKIKMDFLSMGMSQDFEVAVEEGANMLRIGTAIFEGEV
jgi:pyridoxal phosphate enzyme (YggS family)